MSGMDAKTIPLLTAALLALVTLAPNVAYAEKDEAVSGPIVRRKVLYRSTRFEITPHAGLTLNDAFRRNYVFGAGFQYHLTNEFGLGLSGGFAPLHGNTDLANNIELVAPSSALDDISYSQVQWLADLTLSYVPIFGKFSVFKSVTFPYDFHLNGGLSLVNEVGVAAVDGGNVDSEIEGIRPGGVIGGGVRLFLSDMISLNVDLKTLLITRAPVSSGSANAELKPTMYATVGVGIFLPGRVKISR